MSRPFKTEVIGETSCPRCHADARVVAIRPKPKSPFWEILGKCDKCKLEWPTVTEDGSGPLLHDRFKRAIDRRTELMRKYAEAKTPRERGLIMLEVNKIASEEQTWLSTL